MEDKNYNNNSSPLQEKGTITMLLNWFTTMLENICTTTTTTTTATRKPDTMSAMQQVVKRVGQGVVGVVYVGMVLCFLMLLSLVVGVLLVNSFIETPLFVRRAVFFDYTRVNPEATVVVGVGGGGGGEVVEMVPVGHHFRVSLELLLPDSDYNRDIGVFQVTAEVISTNGKVIARSSQPSMLRFQSHPIRLMRTFAMGIPLVLGLARETQKITVNVLNYKETTHLRTGAIKIMLMPRAGTLFLPQLYEAEIVMQSKLPRFKELVYNWKWTFYVWTTSYIYILSLLLLVYFFKPLLVYPLSRSPVIGDRARDTLEGEDDKPESILPAEEEFAGSLRKWQQYRKKRKAELLSMSTKDDISSMSASSYTVTKDDIVPDLEEDVGDSESVCK
ncbi:hypothetical protein RND81_12G169600 [Saponaria officinalis]|uniref:Seipin n=1 Tax=Saponaria officinalis TaxID=3572 RepID=A0AAW1HBN3_SAPOF